MNKENIRRSIEEKKQNKNRKGMLYCLFLMIGLLIIASVTGLFFRAIGFPETNIVLVYLLAVLLTARMTHGYTFGFLACVIATGAFNYFFAEPRFAFSVDASDYIVTFVIMTVTALITSTLTSHAKQNTLDAHKKESDTKALYMLTHRLAGAVDMNDIVGISIRTISNIMNTEAACLCFDENGMSEQTFLQQVAPERQVKRDATNIAELKSQMEELKSVYIKGSEFYDWPLCGREAILGVIRIPKESAKLMNGSQTRLLQAMVESIALAMDRFWSMRQRIRLKEEAVQERYRGNLLRAISHDLRTPLSGIMGTSEMLMDMTQKEDSRYGLVKGIHQDAQWLHSLVENILNLTRLQDGKLTLRKQTEAAEEVVGSAVSHILRRFPKREITVSVPDELLLVPMDARLIEQVLINLLDNAVKHTLPGENISVFVTADKINHCAVFSVSDSGKGIAPADLPNLFQTFYTSGHKRADSQQGIGLGLPICDAIVKAHGGSIEVHNHTDGPGAKFVFTLPWR